jgi:hypothetical protein
MKKFFFFLILLAFASWGFSQANMYHPLPLAQNTIWRTDAFQSYCNDLPNSLCYSFEHHMEGDTTIFGESYFKLFEEILFYQDTSVTDAPLGYLREDTLNKKIYYLCYGCPAEQLIIDFDLQVGDTSPVSLYTA